MKEIEIKRGSRRGVELSVNISDRNLGLVLLVHTLGQDDPALGPNGHDGPGPRPSLWALGLAVWAWPTSRNCNVFILLLIGYLYKFCIRVFCCILLDPLVLIFIFWHNR